MNVVRKLFLFLLAIVISTTITFVGVALPGMLIAPLTAVADGSGIFIDSGQTLGSSTSENVALGDLDGDGDLDAFVANHGANKVWLNDGTGCFTDSGQDLGSSWGWGVALGDVDGDGDLDAFVANSYEVQANKVWLNDGTGIFSDSGQSLGSSSSMDVALGDLDGDGDLDAFVANHMAQANKVWLNDGTGAFSDSGQSLGSSFSLGVALGDVDGDGAPDAFVANCYLGANKVWLNDGTGAFSDSGQSLGSSETTDVALGDVDGDGDPDAFVAICYLGANKVWLNDGTGAFSDSGQSLGSSETTDVALGDVDGDGDLDAFVTNWGGEPNKVWLNDGTGTFSDSGQSLGSSSSPGVALGDVDGDGDLDAFVANADGANKVWLNQNKAHLEATITSPVRTETYSTCQHFDLTFTIHNSGQADALDVTATIDPGATAEVEGQGQGVPWTTPILGDIPGGGTIGPFTYDMHCTGSGDSTITVTPAGTDENTGEPIPGANITPDSVTVEQEWPWTCIFQDPARGTELRVNTDSRTFQFTAPDGYDSGVVEAEHMIVCDALRVQFILIWHGDSQISLFAFAVGCENDFCIAFATDMETGQRYCLVDPPGIE
jgi:hypothetical protein